VGNFYRLQGGKLLIPSKKNIENRGVIKEIAIFLLLIFCFSCFFNNEKTQYIVFKDGKKLQPYAKVIYKVSVERQEVVYWIEFPDKERSQLYKLKKCIVANLNNWGGEADFILLWKIRVEVVNGKISSPGESLVNVDWFRWHFSTDPSPSYLPTIFWGVLLFVTIFGVIPVVAIVVAEWIRIRKEKIAAKNSGNSNKK